MSELSSETQALLDHGRELEPLSPSHRSRMKGAVLAQIAGASIVTTTAATASAGFGLVAKIAAVIAVVGAVGGGSAVMWKMHRAGDVPSRSMAASSSRGNGMPTSNSTPTNAPTQAVVLMPTPTAMPIVAEPVKQPVHAIAKARVAVAPVATVKESAGARLGEEASLLRAADGALARNDYDAALALLDQHAAKFPSGVLEPERATERVFALCGAGRRDEARREADRFASTPGRSPLLVARVRSACSE